MVKLKFSNFHRGISLLEIVIGVGIFMLVAPAIAVLILGGVKGITGNEQKIIAVNLAQEGLEAVRAIRDYSWANLTTGSHGLRNTNGYWEFNGTSEAIAPYIRTITVTDVGSMRRDVASTVTWDAHSYSATTRLTNWRVGPAIGWTQSTVSDFLSGNDFHEVEVIYQGDGAVQIEAGHSNGNFKSLGFNTGLSSPSYLTLKWVQSGNPTGVIKFRTKTSNSLSGLGSAVWLGPDGTRDTYYTVSGTQIITQGGTQWVQYRAYFETPMGGGTPILESVTVEYVP
ncbi:MAG: hypothetical protein V1908_04125 [Candidatus Peregrinibacteria bacterium]